MYIYIYIYALALARASHDSQRPQEAIHYPQPPLLI